MDWPSPGIAAAVTVAIAGLGALLTRGEALAWYNSLAKPRYHLPLTAFLAIAAGVYLIDAVVLYRCLTVVEPGAARISSLSAVVALMLAAEGWNFLFFTRRSVVSGLVALCAYALLLLATIAILAGIDRLSAALLTAYAAFVALYEIPWLYALWRANVRGSSR